MHLSLSAIARYDQFNGVLCWIVCDETTIFLLYFNISEDGQDGIFDCHYGLKKKGRCLLFS